MPLCIQYHTRSLALSLFLRFSRVEPPNTQTNGWIVRGSGRSAPCRKPPSRAAGPAQAYWLRTAVRPEALSKIAGIRHRHFLPRSASPFHQASPGPNHSELTTYSL
ncbi:TPA: hypothetical protein BOS_12974 [Bos taurus]|nr:TPA: hypothetical protein BOS_12974 [Bos taurus]